MCGAAVADVAYRWVCAAATTDDFNAAIAAIRALGADGAPAGASNRAAALVWFTAIIFTMLFAAYFHATLRAAVDIWVVAAVGAAVAVAASSAARA